MKKLVTVVVFVVCFLRLIYPAIGQDSNTKIFKESLDEFMSLPVESNLFDVKITTASLNEESSGKAPAMTRVITEEDIRIRGYQSIRDVLIDLPDFHFNDQVIEDQYNSIITRGVRGQEKIIILLDGQRISSPTNDPMPLLENYPVHLAKQIEVVYGPASALYGADALSGIINIITKTSNKDFAIEASPSIGSHGIYNGDLFVHKKFGKASITLAGKYFQEEQADLSKIYGDDPDYDLSAYDTGTFNTIYGKITPTTPFANKYESPRQAYALFGSLKLEDFQFNFFHNYERHSSSTQVTPNNSIYDKDVFFATRLLMGSMTYSKVLRNISLSSSLMGSTYQIDPQSQYRNVFVGMEPGYKYAYGSEIKLSQTANWRIFKNLNLLAGTTLEYFHSIPKTADLTSPVDKRQSIQGKIPGTDLDAQFFLLNYSNVGGFAQIQYAPHTMVNITLGTRYDYNSRFGATFNPRMGVVVTPSDALTLKVLYSSSFLAPSPLASFRHYGSFFSEDGGQNYHSFFWRLPNPGLKPITSQNIETGFRYLFTGQLSLNVHGYYTWLSDLFSSGRDSEHTHLYDGEFLGWPVDHIEVPINLGKQENYGGTLQLDYRTEWKDLKLNSYLALSYVDGTTDIQENGEKREIGMIAPLQIKAGVDLSWKKLSLSPRVIFVEQQRLTNREKDNPTQRQTLGGYTLLNISARYTFFQKSSLFLNVYNALNQKYRIMNTRANKYKDTYVFYGAPQQPLRLQGGVHFIF